MESDAEDRAFMLINGYKLTQMVRAVTEVKIPDLVAAGPCSTDQLVASTGLQPRALRRVLRSLVAAGVFAETDDGRIVATPISEWLRDRPGSLRGQALMLPSESYEAFGDLMYTLRTGKPAYEHLVGKSLWEKLAKEPERAALFNTAMQFGTEQVRDAVASAYDWSGLRSIVDIGGGRGTLVAGILKAHPHLRGMVYDLDAGLAETDAYLKQQGMRGRCDIATGSFFESVPAGHDAYLLKSIVHDWSDEKAALILASCRRAMKPEARVILVEQVMPARVEDSGDSRRLFIGDVQMMVMLGGEERTEEQYRTLLQRSGLRLTRVISTESRFHLIEAAPA